MEELCYPSSENKGADQLRGYREADLRLCFRICRLLVFLMSRLIYGLNVVVMNSGEYDAPVIVYMCHSPRPQCRFGSKPGFVFSSVPAVRVKYHRFVLCKEGSVMWTYAAD